MPEDTPHYNRLDPYLITFKLNMIDRSAC